MRKWVSASAAGGAAAEVEGAEVARVRRTLYVSQGCRDWAVCRRRWFSDMAEAEEAERVPRRAFGLLLDQNFVTSLVS